MIRRIIDYEIGWRFSDDCPGVHIRTEGSQELMTLPVSDNAVEALFLLNLLQGEKDLFWDDQTDSHDSDASLEYIVISSRVFRRSSTGLQVKPRFKCGIQKKGME